MWQRANWGDSSLSAAVKPTQSEDRRQLPAAQSFDKLRRLIFLLDCGLQGGLAAPHAQVTNNNLQVGLDHWSNFSFIQLNCTCLSLGRAVTWLGSLHIPEAECAEPPETTKQKAMFQSYLGKSTIRLMIPEACPHGPLLYLKVRMRSLQFESSPPSVY